MTSLKKERKITMKKSQKINIIKKAIKKAGDTFKVVDDCIWWFSWNTDRGSFPIIKILLFFPVNFLILIYIFLSDILLNIPIYRSSYKI